MFGLILFLIVVILIVALVISTLVIVPEGKSYVIEYLGKYKETWQAGLHFKIPFFERVARKISVKEQVADFPPQPVITKDNVNIQIDTVVYFKVFDSKLFTYGVENPIVALENLTATTLRNIIGDLTLDATLTSRDIVNTKMKEIVDEATDAWGISCTRVELKNITAPAEIQAAMEKQMKAEREKRQAILEAQAHQESVIARAEGDKRAKILAAEAEKESQIAMAEGKARAIELVYEAEAEGLRKLRDAGIDDSVISIKKLEALQKVADGRATKIILPTDLANAASDITLKAELLGLGESIDCTPKIPADVSDDPCCEDRYDYRQSKTTEEIKKHK